MGKNLTYRKAGVDIDKADAFIDAIMPLVKKTHRPELIGDIGGFNGLFRADFKKMKEPVLVSSTDGVGTKLLVANVIKKYDTVGIDLVAMCVNDVITCGAEPLFFLDYYAVEGIDINKSVSIVKGIAEGCMQAGCVLIGGETAEMPGLYPRNEFDLAGFCVGVVDRKRIIDGSSIKKGDVLLGIQSSGLHSNGFSLVRKVFARDEMKSSFLKKELLKPTFIYVKPVLSMSKKLKIKGIANITGGGFYENIPRILPEAVSVKIKKNSWHIQPIFDIIRKEGNIPEREMYRTFNMGIGMVLVLADKDVNKAKGILARRRLKSWVIGQVIKGGAGGQEVIIE